MNSVQIIQVFLLIIIVIGIMYLLRKQKTMKYIERIGIYGVDSIKVEPKTLLTTLTNIYIKIVKFISKYFFKDKISSKLSKRYSQYGDIFKNIKKQPTDYLIDKFLLGVVFVFVVFICGILASVMVSTTECFMAFCLGYFSLDIYFNYMKKIRKNKIRTDLLKAIIIMNSVFKAGKTTIQALEIAKNELPYPTNMEFEKMHNDIVYGLPLDVVFERFSKRVDIEEARYISSSLTILQKTGGNIVKVFSSIERSLFDKKKLAEELKNLTVNSNMIIKILMLVPFVFIGLISLLNPTYFTPLFQSTSGYIITSIMIIMFTVYIFLLKQIMKVKV